MKMARKEIHLYTNRVQGVCVLTFGHHLIGDKNAMTVEYFSDEMAPMYDYMIPEARRNFKMLGLGKGVHMCPFRGHTIRIDVSNLIEGKLVMVPREASIFRLITLSLKDGDEMDPNNILGAFIAAAKEYVDAFLEDYRREEDCVKKYVYNMRHDDWEVLNTSPNRSFDTVFMEPNVKENLVEFIHDFVRPETRDDYRRFGIPYKCNIMLHGPPGTGKSSTIHSIATEIDSDIAIVHFTAGMGDDKLMRSINLLSELKKCKIIVMEDVDSLFINRKEHDTEKNSVTLSGLLNALDGLSRMEGVMVCLTTNHLDALDHAMLRPGRLDYLVKYSYASKDLIQQVYNFYFPESGEELFNSFYNAVSSHKITPSMLQQYFFRYRKNPALILNKVSTEFMDIIKERGNKTHGSKDEEGQNHLYM